MSLSRLQNILSYGLIFFIFFLPAIDTDLGWHLRYGEYLVKTGSVLRENSLTYFLSDYHWAHSYTLHQLTTFLLHKIGGLSLLAVAYGLLGSLCFHLYRRLTQKTPLFLSLTSFVVITILGWNVFYIGWRAQVFTFLGILLTLFFLEKSKDKRYLWSLPAIFLFWANTHGGFILGLAILSFKLIQTIFERDTKEAMKWAIVLMVSTLATLINPYHINIWLETLKHSQYPLEKLIAEWLPPQASSLAIGLPLASLSLYLAWTRTKEKVFYSLLVILGALLLIEARRNTPLFALLISFPLIDMLRPQVEKLIKIKNFQAFATLTLGSILLTLLVIRVPNTLELSISKAAYCQKAMVEYPCASIEFIKANNPQGKNMYTAYEWGGFLEWKLPEYKPFVDGRTPAWPTKEGKSPYTIYLEIIQAQAGYQEKLDEYKTDWLLIGNGTFLDIELKQNPAVQWREVHRDSVAVVYTRKND